jgi:hypothetical protein
MAGPSNLRGVGAEFIAEGIPSAKPTSAYQLSPLVETNIAKPDGGNLGNPNGNKRENRLVSKWRSGRLRLLKCFLDCCEFIITMVFETAVMFT